ncbi:hypothetical protein [Photobacterium profundum]|uniref:hypothetical protein n=1 Tax=Photobacterium profundum TaxID=74109 RepID=UPI003D0F11DA
MKKIKLLAVAIGVILLGSQASAASVDNTTPIRFSRLQHKLVDTDNKLKLWMFTGSGLNYGHSMPIKATLTDNNSKLSLIFNQMHFSNVNDINNLLVAPSDGSLAITNSEFSQFIYHSIAPTVNLVPYGLTAHSAMLDKSINPEIKCSFVSIKDSSDNLVTTSHNYTQSERLSVAFSCPIDTNNVNNDMIYNISWNVLDSDIYKFKLPAEKTQYRLALTSGNSNFKNSDAITLTPRIYMAMSFEDVAVQNDRSIMPHSIGPNGTFKFNIHMSPTETEAAKTAALKVQTSLEALGYHPNFEFVSNWQEANILVYKAQLPYPTIRGAAMWGAQSNKNLIKINTNTDLHSDFSQFVFMHELSHIIGMAHQTDDVQSLMGQSNHLPTILAPSENSQQNTVYSYVDAQVLSHLAEQNQ